MTSDDRVLCRRPRRLVAVLAVVLAAVLIPAAAGAATDAATQQNKQLFTLTVLHNNDGESQLIDAGSGLEDFGGVARFATLVHKLERKAVKPRPGEKRGAIVISSGDNFLAGPEFNASSERGVPFFDTAAMALIGYDAATLGNHEFDFGPETLADFVRGFPQARRGFFGTPFLSANLDFSGEPRLQALVDQRRIAKSTIVRERGERIGIIGATTENLPFISSPRGVVVNAVLSAVQTEIDRLTKLGVNKIILSSHLQGIDEDIELISKLSGIDVVIAGGGDELLADDGDVLIPGDELDDRFGSYPVMAKDADGRDVPIVTTPGDYKYVGRLIIKFNKNGRIVQIRARSGLVRVAGGDNPDAVKAHPLVQALVVSPVSESVAALAANVIATSEVGLDGRRSPGVRTGETNLGSLLADALLWQARELAGSFGVPSADVALQNGGGIRNNNVIPAGPISELDTFSISPFPNFVTVVPDIPASQFKEIMENAVSKVETSSGRFAQVAGFTMVYDPSGTAQVLDDDGNVVTPGTRVKTITLDDGTKVVEGGAVVAGAKPLTVASIDFLVRGGDQYPYRDAAFTPVGVTYQQALENYIIGPLGGLISAAAYPEGGEGRITATS